MMVRVLALSAALGFSVGLASFGLTSSALTQTTPSTTYRGVATIGGGLFDGALTLRFELRQDAPDAAPAHCEEHRVDVRGGTFVVELGTGAPVNGCASDFRSVIRARRDLYLTLVAMDGPEGVNLIGSQRITPDGYSLGAADHVGDVPIGGIISWFRPTPSFPIPDGFVLAHGGIVEDPDSPIDGATIPDLRDLFIRGTDQYTEMRRVDGSTAEEQRHGLQIENHPHGFEFQNHQHAFEDDHTHTTTSAGSHNHAIIGSNIRSDDGGNPFVRLYGGEVTGSSGHHSHPVPGANIEIETHGGGATGPQETSEDGSATLEARTQSTHVPYHYGVLKLMRIK